LHTRPNVIWTNHIKLLPLALFTSRLTGGIPTVGNVYGLEVWSGLRISELFSLKKATKVVSDCHSTAAFIGSLGVGSERISVIWDPVDVRRFFPKDTKQKILKKYGIPYHSKNCYLMTLGRISKTSRHKGYDRIIDVISSIDRDDLVYLIVGDGDDKRRLEERVIKEGLSQRIFLLGSVPEYELSDVYNGADIFVLVSDRGPGRGEGVPLTPLEAAACGKPIIVGNEDGSREAIIDGESGFIVSPRDLNSIRQAILRLVDNKELRENMGHSARLRVKREFSKEVFKSRTENLVESIF
jgi:phosphatidylinositol alpha-1,6-mannosyltransferase